MRRERKGKCQRKKDMIVSSLSVPFTLLSLRSFRVKRGERRQERTEWVKERRDKEWSRRGAKWRGSCGCLFTSLFIPPRRCPFTHAPHVTSLLSTVGDAEGGEREERSWSACGSRLRRVLTMRGVGGIMSDTGGFFLSLYPPVSLSPPYGYERSEEKASDTSRPNEVRIMT